MFQVTAPFQKLGPRGLPSFDGDGSWNTQTFMTGTAHPQTKPFPDWKEQFGISDLRTPLPLKLTPRNERQTEGPSAGNPAWLIHLLPFPSCCSWSYHSQLKPVVPSLSLPPRPSHATSLLNRNISTLIKCLSFLKYKIALSHPTPCVNYCLTSAVKLSTFTVSMFSFSYSSVHSEKAADPPPTLQTVLMVTKNHHILKPVAIFSLHPTWYSLWHFLLVPSSCHTLLVALDFFSWLALFYPPFELGFFSASTTAILGLMSFHRGGCAVPQRMLQHPWLLPTRCQYQLPYQTATSKNVPRHCSMSPGEHNCPRLRTIAFYDGSPLLCVLCRRFHSHPWLKWPPVYARESQLKFELQSIHPTTYLISAT